MNKFIQMVLDFGTDKMLPDRNVQSKYDPKTGVLDISWEITPEELGVMVQQRYADGDTHEEVTAWLERCTPEYPRVLTECFDENGKRHWVRKFQVIHATLTINSPSAPPV
jgi:hypothetical protein